MLFFIAHRFDAVNWLVEIPAVAADNLKPRRPGIAFQNAAFAGLAIPAAFDLPYFADFMLKRNEAYDLAFSRRILAAVLFCEWINSRNISGKAGTLAEPLRRKQRPQSVADCCSPQ